MPVEHGRIRAVARIPVELTDELLAVSLLQLADVDGCDVDQTARLVRLIAPVDVVHRAALSAATHHGPSDAATLLGLQFSSAQLAAARARVLELHPDLARHARATGDDLRR